MERHGDTTVGILNEILMELDLDVVDVFLCGEGGLWRQISTYYILGKENYFIIPWTADEDEVL